MINVTPDGTIKFIYADDLRGLMAEGKATTRRVSHVEPNQEGRWTAQIVDGPLLGPFDTRQEALNAEVKWLKENL